METMKKLKWSIIILAAAYIVLGVVLIIYPGKTMNVISYILAATLIIFGTVNLIQYMRTDALEVFNKYDLVIGFSAIIGGVLIILNVERFEHIINIALGFMVTISGILKFQNSINLLRLKSNLWTMPFGMAIINIVFGVILLINPFAAEMFLILLGIGFIYSGISDIIVTVMISSALSKITDVANTNQQAAQQPVQQDQAQ
ncbi:MAG: DUF308 domain-containing protein [Eubacterium sp.]|nr:DUF308 domain-containing protein [Eubacterium sp.]